MPCETCKAPINSTLYVLPAAAEIAEPRIPAIPDAVRFCSLECAGEFILAIQLPVAIAAH